MYCPIKKGKREFTRRVGGVLEKIVRLTEPVPEENAPPYVRLPKRQYPQDRG